MAEIICFQDPPVGSCFCNCGTDQEPHQCDHQFNGWEDFADGSGGEATCTICGMGAMYHSLHT